MGLELTAPKIRSLMLHRLSQPGAPIKPPMWFFNTTSYVFLPVTRKEAPVCKTQLSSVMQQVHESASRRGSERESEVECLVPTL